MSTETPSDTTAGQDAGVDMTCPKCKREVRPWPLQRGAKCSPDSWVSCIRNDDPKGWKR